MRAINGDGIQVMSRAAVWPAMWFAAIEERRNPVHTGNRE
jgi:hypothetical protein